MARTVADAFNQYHQNYVKPQVESKLSTSAAVATYATQASLAVKADLDSPNLTGTPTAPTPGNDTDSTQIATTEFCQNLIRRLVGSAPETLNTLVELATAINNDPNFAETIVQALDGKLNKTDAANTYLAKTANAASASRDENGNVIHTTYATKTELGNVIPDGITKYKDGTLFYGQQDGDFGFSITPNERVCIIGASDFNDGILIDGYTTFVEKTRFEDKVFFGKSEDDFVGKAGSNLEMYHQANGTLTGINCSNTFTEIFADNTTIKLLKSTGKVEITASGGLYVNGTKIA